MSYAEARFSDLHAVLNALLHALGIVYQLVPISHPTFIEGRAGAILVEGQEIGFIGEIHPEVLTQWEIGVPAVAFEMRA
jgi:phenylalanyl-tRNA synthetase beta chain